MFASMPRSSRGARRLVFGQLSVAHRGESSVWVAIGISLLSLIVAIGGTFISYELSRDAKEANRIAMLGQKAEIDGVYLRTWAAFSDRSQLPCSTSYGAELEIEFAALVLLTNNGGKLTRITRMIHSEFAIPNDEDFRRVGSLDLTLSEFTSAAEFDQWASEQGGPNDTQFFGQVHDALPSDSLETPATDESIPAGESKYLVLHGVQRVHFGSLEEDTLVTYMQKWDYQAEVQFVFENSTVLTVPLPLVKPNENAPTNYTFHIKECDEDTA